MSKRRGFVVRWTQETLLCSSIYFLRVAQSKNAHANYRTSYVLQTYHTIGFISRSPLSLYIGCADARLHAATTALARIPGVKQSSCPWGREQWSGTPSIMSVPHKHNSFCFSSRLCDYRPALPRPPRQAPACFFLISCAITSNEACQTIAESYTAATWVVSYDSFSLYAILISPC